MRRRSLSADQADPIILKPVCLRMVATNGFLRTRGTLHIKPSNGSLLYRQCAAP
jgi:hypothetical protein